MPRYMLKAQTAKTFADVAGTERSKKSLTRVVEFLHNPLKYKEIEPVMPKGSIACGPPGTAKPFLQKL